MKSERHMTDPIRQVQDTLSPLLVDICELLADPCPEAGLFFQEVLGALRRSTCEDDLIGTFVLLSTAAFQGFHYPVNTVQPVDHLLEVSVNIAHAFMASVEQRH
jgi:hypothetical protein